MATAIQLYKDSTDNAQKKELEGEIKNVEKEMTKMKNAAGGNIN